MKEFNMLVWLTQLGISIAAPMALCIMGAFWLRNRFGLGAWVLIAGILLGLYLAFDGFRVSMKAMEKMTRSKHEKDPPPVSFNDHH